MIRINAIGLTMIFGFMLLKPAIPYMEYIVRKDFIIENFCINKDKNEMKCNGKCHLEEQVLEETSRSTEKDLPFPPEEDKNEWRDYLISQNPVNRFFLRHIIIKTDYSLDYTFQYIHSIFHPPMQGLSC